jgi:hypothetical protein
MAFGRSHWIGRPAAALSPWSPDVLGRRCTARQRMLFPLLGGEDQGEGELFSPQALISFPRCPGDCPPAQAIPSRGSLTTEINFPAPERPCPSDPGGRPFFNRDVSIHTIAISLLSWLGKPAQPMLPILPILPKKIAKSAILLGFQEVIRGYPAIPVNRVNPVSNLPAMDPPNENKRRLDHAAIEDGHQHAGIAFALLGWKIHVLTIPGPPPQHRRAHPVGAGSFGSVRSPDMCGTPSGKIPASPVKGDIGNISPNASFAASRPPSAPITARPQISDSGSPARRAGRY